MRNENKFIIHLTDAGAHGKLFTPNDRYLEERPGAKQKLEEDKALYYTTLDNIRKDAGLKFEDKELKKAYNKYMQKLKSEATSDSQSN